MAERKEVQIEIKAVDQASPAFNAALAAAQRLFARAAREEEAARQQSVRVLSIESETRQARLRAAGLGLQAELESIREGFRRKFMLVASEAEKLALAELQIVREYEAKKAATRAVYANDAAGRGAFSDFRVSAATAAEAHRMGSGGGPGGAGGAGGGFSVLAGGAGGLLRAAGIGAGIIQTVRGGLVGVQAASSAIEGDWAKVQEHIDRLPLGIGKINQELRQVVFQTTGVNAAIEKSKSTIEQMEAGRQKYLGLIGARDQLRGISGALGREAAGASMNPFDRARAEAGSVYGDQLKGIDALAKAAGEQSDPEAVAAARAAARRIYNERIKAIDHDEAVNHQAKLDGIDAMAKASADQRIAEEERVAAVEAEIRQRTLMDEGRTLEAKLDQIREHFRLRWNEARTAQERERLDQLQAIEEASATRQDSAARMAAAAPGRGIARAANLAAESLRLVLDRNISGVSALAGANSASPNERTAKNTQGMAESLKKIESLLMKQSAPGVARGTGVLAL